MSLLALSTSKLHHSTGLIWKEENDIYKYLTLIHQDPHMMSLLTAENILDKMDGIMASMNCIMQILIIGKLNLIAINFPYIPLMGNLLQYVIMLCLLLNSISISLVN